MKYIRYMFNNRVNIGTEESPEFVDNLFSKTIIYTEANEEIAKKEAYNGDYIIEDDGQPEPAPKESTDDILNALLGVTE